MRSHRCPVGIPVLQGREDVKALGDLGATDWRHKRIRTFAFVVAAGCAALALLIVLSPAFSLTPQGRTLDRGVRIALISAKSSRAAISPGVSIIAMRDTPDAEIAGAMLYAASVLDLNLFRPLLTSYSPDTLVAMYVPDIGACQVRASALAFSTSGSAESYQNGSLVSLGTLLRAPDKAWAFALLHEIGHCELNLRLAKAIATGASNGALLANPDILNPEAFADAYAILILSVANPSESAWYCDAILKWREKYHGGPFRGRYYTVKAVRQVCVDVVDPVKRATLAWMPATAAGIYALRGADTQTLAAY